MPDELTLGELFAGVGGFTLGFEAAGYTTRWQVEIDEQCQGVLARHWPHTAKYRDIRDVHGAELAPVSVITFGSPCQDLSVAGKRAGLDGRQSVLFYEAIRIIREMRTAHTLPTVAVWENVPGALSSNDGRDFGAALDALADLGPMAIAWRELDAQEFGLPHRRRRVLTMATFGNHGARQLLTHTPGVPGHHPTSDPEQRNHPGRTYGGPHREGQRVITFGHKQGLSIQPSTVSTPTLRAQGAGAAILTVDQLRRLTPKEAERLMGWPDDHTRWTADGRALADHVRYRQVGNGVAAPMAQWLAQLIANQLQGTNP